jgi:long-chain acyl-CoA synthetase
MNALTLASLPYRAAERFGDKVALHCEGRPFSFLELERRITALAAGLSDLGLRSGQRVILYLPNSWQWIVSYYAIARIGCVVVPANILLAGEEIQFMAEDCGASALIAPAERTVALASLIGQPLALVYITVGDPLVPSAAQFETLLITSRRCPTPDIAPEDISTICYTSGTTGRPKGAVLTHAAIVLNTAMTATMHVRTAEDIVVTALPCTHVYGNVVMNGAFLCGYSLVLMARFDTEQVLEAIERYEATLFEGVPTMYFYLIGSEVAQPRRPKTLRRATVGGQTMPISQLLETRKWLGCPLLELWGMTEIAGPGTTHSFYGQEKLGSIGLPLPSNHLKIVELHDRTSLVETGGVGEMLIRGSTLMREYWNRPEETDAVLHNGWLATGDLAYRDQDDYLYVVDRVKEMIITAGYNIYPSELERVIAEHPAVQMVAVGAAPDLAKGELAIAYVVLKVSGIATEETLLTYCRTRLASYKVPRAVRFVTELPKTSTGKIMRRALAHLAN